MTSLLLGLAAAALLLTPFARALFAYLRGVRRRTDDEDGDSGSGGGGSRRSGPDGPRAPDGEPAWWPEFEREFAAWVDQAGSAVSAPNSGA